jgi:general secretion pathway protein J
MKKPDSKQLSLAATSILRRPPGVIASNQGGFTLLELLISSIIFAIMAVMAYGGLSNVLDNSKSSQQALLRLQQVQQSVSVLNRDFSQIIPRGIRDEYGNKQPYLTTANNLDNLIEFTRGGRVWPQLDRAQGIEARQSTLIDNIENVTIRFLDENGEWQEQWPPLNAGTGGTQGLTSIKLAAIEIVMQLKDWGDIRRLYAMN